MIYIKLYTDISILASIYRSKRPLYGLPEVKEQIGGHSSTHRPQKFIENVHLASIWRTKRLLYGLTEVKEQFRGQFWTHTIKTYKLIYIKLYTIIVILASIRRPFRSLYGLGKVKEQFGGHFWTHGPKKPRKRYTSSYILIFQFWPPFGGQRPFTASGRSRSIPEAIFELTDPKNLENNIPKAIY